MKDLDKLPSPDCLTPLQKRVATLVREGMYRREIARELGTTPDAVDTEISVIQQTLGIADLLTLAFYVDCNRHQLRRPTSASSLVKSAIA